MTAESNHTIAFGFGFALVSHWLFKNDENSLYQSHLLWLPGNYTVTERLSFTFTFHWVVITSRIPSVRGWLKMTIACA